MEANFTTLFAMHSAPKPHRNPSLSATPNPPKPIKIPTFPFPKRKAPSFIVHCTSLKPRPKHVAAETVKPVTAPPPSSSLSAQLERLAFFGKSREALELFEILQCGGGDEESLSSATYDALANACIGLRSPGAARSVFRHMVDTGFQFDQYARNRVLLMYLKCGLVSDARRLFEEMPERNAVSWNTMISGLLGERSFEEAFRLFLLMLEEIPEAVGSRSLVFGVQACTGLGSVFLGSQLHSAGFKLGLCDNIFVSSALIDMYSNCGCIDEARWVFDEMPEKNVVAWNTIVAGYALHGYSEDALGLYYEMQKSGVRTDQFTYSTVIRICARLGSLEHAKQAHAGMVRNGYGADLVANTALIDLYRKWGRMEDARNVFDRMPRRNLRSWNALIGGYGAHGMGEEAVALFDRLTEKKGLVPNQVTFLAVLNACSSSGLSGKGLEIFKSMAEDPRTKPRAMHFASMVDLLGREGRLDEALDLIKNAPFPPTENMWAALLTACRVNENLELGKFAAEKLFWMEPEKLSNYIVLLNIYNGSGRVSDAANVLEVMKRRGLRLLPACSWIEVKKQPHEFAFGDTSHPKSSEIYKKLGEVMEEIGTLGYAHGGGECFLPDVGVEEQRGSECHSEKLAIAFGLISTSSSSPLQVVQGHRVCDDCHGAIKMVTVVTKRAIVVRDASRFHHFRHGACSCGDYW
ncbi:pentatricopeptide repeat-containing protein, chloroplastic isoform X2 [Iris pallida]|uniref:Pentatricopeptide repeat-containing protein isoform X2, chloroplastic n=1 Tax=Iris pallida TaxID=29817 RepID=A0AAX6HTE7_IRIPA|nr:pentatricopeptide repeat-containing protein isoform X2, chloroplastic [Iris pallida]KAJ6843545.1 pentatricopeptide repeat-containing protein, chloroplastic isoform X2 [Iris pallida]